MIAEIPHEHTAGTWRKEDWNEGSVKPYTSFHTLIMPPHHWKWEEGMC